MATRWLVGTTDRDIGMKEQDIIADDYVVKGGVLTFFKNQVASPGEFPLPPKIILVFAPGYWNYICPMED